MSEKLMLWGEGHDDTDPRPRQRLPYGAVPLDPWHAQEEDGRTYWGASVERIGNKLEQTMNEQGWGAHPQGERLRTLMEGSLVQSHYARVEKNMLVNITKAEDAGDDLLTLAKAGLASPQELLALLDAYPDMGSVELAKLSHPFDFAASNDMDRTMDELILRSEGAILSAEPRFKVKRVDTDLPAAILLRKQDLVDIPTEHGTIRIVERRGFLLFDGAGAEDDPYFKRRIKNADSYVASDPHRFSLLTGKVEQRLYDDDKHQQYGWLQPQATSYYAKYASRRATKE